MESNRKLAEELKAHMETDLAKAHESLSADWAKQKQRAEAAEARAEKAERERDAAVYQMRGDCEKCAHFRVTWNGCTPDFECPISDRCLNRDMWEWNGGEKGGISVERLTTKDKVIGYQMKCSRCCEKTIPCNECEEFEALVDRIGTIEGILGKNYDLDRLRDLVEADRDGRCVVLPVKPGGVVRFAKNPRAKKETVDAITIYPDGKMSFGFHEYGVKTEWVDRWSEDDADKYVPVEAAEAALKGDQDG